MKVKIMILLTWWEFGLITVLVMKQVDSDNSSAGRAEDCRVLWLSFGRWFNSSLSEFFFEFFKSNKWLYFFNLINFLWTYQFIVSSNFFYALNISIFFISLDFFFHDYKILSYHSKCLLQRLRYSFSGKTNYWNKNNFSFLIFFS